MREWWEGSGKMNGSVEWRVVGRWIGGWWEIGGRVVGVWNGGWWEGSERGGGCRGAPLELPRGSQGPARVASEKSGPFSRCQGPVGILLESLPVNRAVSRVQSGNSVFFSGGDRDLGPPIKVQQGSQASLGVEAWNSAFLSSCQRAVRPLVEFRWGNGAFSRG